MLVIAKNKNTNVETLPSANTVIHSAALVPRPRGRGMAIGTAAILRLCTIRANHGRVVALCRANLWSGSYCN